MLLAGLTDASVAKQLDLGLRTVQRRVKGLMELTGVSTRLQLGWHAYERGWVSREPRWSSRASPRQHPDRPAPSLVEPGEPPGEPVSRPRTAHGVS